MDSPSRIVSEMSAAVFRLAYRIVGDRDQALDISQEVFVKVLCGQARKISEDKVRAYVMKSAYNLALNHRRDLGRRMEKLRVHQDILRPEDVVQPDASLQHDEVAFRLNRAVEALPEKQREVVSLRFFSGLTFAEIGQVMSVAEGTVKVHLARGLQRLRSILRETAGKENL